MAAVRNNIVANVVGRAWVAAAGLIFLPVYARVLGMEAFALVGFFASLSAVLGVLDLGLVATLDREIARSSSDGTPDAALRTRDLVRTFEIVFLGLGAATGAVVALLAPFLARDWLNSDELPIATIESAVRVMGLIVALQWPFGIYAGGLVGLQHQVAANALQVGATTFRALGGLALLLWVSPTVEAYFAWQLLASFLHTVAARAMLMRVLPKTQRNGLFRKESVLHNWRFSMGMSGISLVGVALTQVDRVLLSRALSLSDFGYYSLASTVGRSLMYLTAPIFVAVYPRLCQLVADKKSEDVNRLYHAACQTMAVAILPATLVLALFSREILSAWTGDDVLVEHTWATVAAVAVGTGLTALVNIPYALQLAAGWTSVPFWANALILVLLVPLTILGAHYYGSLGAALAWPVVNVIYVAVMATETHRRLLPGQQGRWLREDLALPFASAFLVALVSRLLWTQELGRIGDVVGVVGVGLLAVAASALAAPEVRNRIPWRRARAA